MNKTVSLRETIEPVLEEVAAFLAVVELESFSAAARRLNLDRSSVSRRVAQLEGKLGVRLLHRTTRSLALTESGRIYHDHVSRAFAGLKDAEEAVRQLDRTPRGHLRITAPVDMKRELSMLVTEFSRRHTEVSIEVDLTQRYVDLIAEGFDLALRAGPLPDSSLVAKRVGQAALRLFASPAYLQRVGTPQAVNDLAHHSFVLFRSAGQQNLSLEHDDGTRREIGVAGRIATNEFGFLREAVIAQAGVGILPIWSAAEAVERQELTWVLPNWSAGTSPLHVVYPSARLLSAKVAAFRDFAVQWFDRECRLAVPDTIAGK